MSIIKRVGTHIPILKDVIERRYYESIVDLRKMSQDDLIKALMNKYERLMGYRMDINHPVTYTEKVQWYKLFYTQKDGEDLIRVVDKYLFKNYIKEKLGEDGYTLPLYGVYNSFDELEQGWGKLPKEFVLKSTLSSEGKNIKFVHDKSKVDVKSLRKELKYCFNDKYMLCNSFCRAYHNGVPRIIAEQYMENVKDQLFDYKIFCFDGTPYCVETVAERFLGGNPAFTFYDMEWHKMEVQSGNHPNSDMPKPKHFGQMIELSQKLSEGFPHVRVDFFDTREKLYVAELTLYTGGYQHYTPQSFNEKMGKLFKLPIDK